MISSSHGQGVKQRKWEAYMQNTKPFLKPGLRNSGFSKKGKPKSLFSMFLIFKQWMSSRKTQQRLISWAARVDVPNNGAPIHQSSLIRALPTKADHREVAWVCPSLAGSRRDMELTYNWAPRVRWQMGLRNFQQANLYVSLSPSYKSRQAFNVGRKRSRQTHISFILSLIKYALHSAQEY